jgi:hypothetical protein
MDVGEVGFPQIAPQMSTRICECLSNIAEAGHTCAMA